MGATTGGGGEGEQPSILPNPSGISKKSAGRECSLDASMHMVYFSLDPCELGKVVNNLLCISGQMLSLILNARSKDCPITILVSPCSLCKTSDTFLNCSAFVSTNSLVLYTIASLNKLNSYLKLSTVSM